MTEISKEIDWDISLGSQTGDNGFFADIFFRDVHILTVREEVTGFIKIECFDSVGVPINESTKLQEFLAQGIDYVSGKRKA